MLEAGERNMVTVPVCLNRQTSRINRSLKFYDVYNGDADGLCALLQLRLNEPRDTVLVSGVKRDNALLERVDAQRGDEITVLDVSLDVNRDALERALQNGARVSWFDHHHPGKIPVSPAFVSHIDTDPATCTSLIVDRYLGGKFRLWAIVAAFGDNLEQPARHLAGAVGLAAPQTELLRDLGICLNYNAYGETVDDLLYSPIELFRNMSSFTDPREFVHSTDILAALQVQIHEDLTRAQAVRVKPIAPGSAFAVLPDTGWSRRVLGVYANELARREPHTAHAIMVERAGGYKVSIRAPIAEPRGASDVARAFDSGGGRLGAAGIDFLPSAELDRLFVVMRDTFPGDR